MDQRWKSPLQRWKMVGRQINPLLFILPIFTFVNHKVFTKFYETSVEVIDEEFHLHQARDYCEFHFDRWHPKITTPPGLYYLATVLCHPLNHCDTYCFRHVSFIASIANLILFHKILQIGHKSWTWTALISAINLSLLPPLYFFSHLYYSDIASLTVILLMLYCYLRNQHFLTSAFGVCSIFMRQTNVIWVVMFAGQYFLNFIDVFHPVSVYHLYKSLIKAPFIFWCNLFAYGSVILSFIGFVWINGGIVLGDKSAHQAELHLPQILYFSLFSLIFGIFHFLDQIKTYFISFGLYNNRGSLFLLLIIALIIHFNTLEHPYLLADNRHYIFYVWNRYLKYYIIRMAMTTVYHFGLFGLTKTFYDRSNIWPFVTFVPCLIMVLCFQKLIEVRYFIIPFVLWRLQLRRIKLYKLICEFMFYFLINVITIKIFFDKEIRWDDRSAVQRIIW